MATKHSWWWDENEANTKAISYRFADFSVQGILIVHLKMTDVLHDITQCHMASHHYIGLEEIL